MTWRKKMLEMKLGATLISKHKVDYNWKKGIAEVKLNFKEKDDNNSTKSKYTKHYDKLGER